MADLTTSYKVFVGNRMLLVKVGDHTFNRGGATVTTEMSATGESVHKPGRAPSSMQFRVYNDASLTSGVRRELTDYRGAVRYESGSRIEVQPNARIQIGDETDGEFQFTITGDPVIDAS
ncbi:MAG: hypothetical protein KC543_00840 [Myxococcales bacterium]|nr:hypothetical protein [Myxococcales bacterium]